MNFMCLLSHHRKPRSLDNICTCRDKIDDVMLLFLGKNIVFFSVNVFAELDILCQHFWISSVKFVCFGDSDSCLTNERRKKWDFVG